MLLKVGNHLSFRHLSWFKEVIMFWNVVDRAPDCILLHPLINHLDILLPLLPGLGRFGSLFARGPELLGLLSERALFEDLAVAGGRLVLPDHVVEGVALGRVLDSAVERLFFRSFEKLGLTRGGLLVLQALGIVQLSFHVVLLFQEGRVQLGRLHFLSFLS